MPNAAERQAVPRSMRARAAAGVLVSWALVLAASAGAYAAEGAEKAWAELFAEDNPAAATGKIDAVLSAVGNDEARLRGLIGTDTAYPALKPGIHKQSLQYKAGEKDWEVHFLLRVPAGYTPRESWPMIVAAHGMGGSGAGMTRSFQVLLGRDIERFILVAPDMPGPPGWKAEQYQQRAHLEPLAWARRRLNVDDDRIYLAGYSQGGHLTWQLSTFHPRLFAATVPLAGAPTAEGFPYTTTTYLRNHQLLPMWAIWGENDGPAGPKEGIVDFCRRAAKELKKLHNTAFRGTELPGKGHGDCWPDGREFLKFLSDHKRIPPPQRYQHVFHMPYHARGYYVEATAFTRTPMDMRKKQPVLLAPGTAPTQENLIAATRRLYASKAFRLSVQVDAKRNILRVLPTGIRSARIYLPEGLLDLSKPVILLLAGRPWRGKIPVSPRCILQHYAATRDAPRLILNELDATSAGKVTVRYK